VATNAQGYRLVKISAARGTTQNAMKYIVAALLGVNAVIGLLIFVLNQQL